MKKREKNYEFENENLKETERMKKNNDMTEKKKEQDNKKFIGEDISD